AAGEVVAARLGDDVDGAARGAVLSVFTEGQDVDFLDRVERHVRGKRVRDRVGQRVDAVDHEGVRVDVVAGQVDVAGADCFRNRLQRILIAAVRGTDRRVFQAIFLEVGRLLRLRRVDDDLARR